MTEFCALRAFISVSILLPFFLHSLSGDERVKMFHSLSFILGSEAKYCEIVGALHVSEMRRQHHQISTDMFDYDDCSVINV